MRETHHIDHPQSRTGFGSVAPNNSVRLVLSRAKDGVLQDYAPLMGEHTHLLRLALNEAEALAWSTEVPQLVFPLLAREKAEFALAWHRRQKAVRRAGAEISLAE